MSDNNEEKFLGPEYINFRYGSSAILIDDLLMDEEYDIKTREMSKEEAKERVKRVERFIKELQYEIKGIKEKIEK